VDEIVKLTEKKRYDCASE